mmetsp:Transcript_68194/g.168500  ORF Transcript_68194/g.168500 Transcript_68194/m.168500 type:complete len:94 (+) Transcript_68194:313-594(+)
MRRCVCTVCFPSTDGLAQGPFQANKKRLTRLRRLGPCFSCLSPSASAERLIQAGQPGASKAAPTPHKCAPASPLASAQTGQHTKSTLRWKFDG